MLKNILIVLCIVYYVRSQEDIGDPCTVEGRPGVCKSIYECDYAKRVVNEDQKKPKTCSFDGATRIVCCPPNFDYGTGVFKRYFIKTDDGVIRSNNIVCRYSGKQPMTCCQDVSDDSLNKEPPGCPKLKVPRLNAPPDVVEEIAWGKCLDYQKLVYKCVASENNPDKFVRENTCDSVTLNNVPRIAGGYEARVKEFPHMAVLGCQNAIETDDMDIVWIGGGSLISDKYILTAAHVLIDPVHGKVKYALLGALNKKDLRSGIVYNINRKIPHKLYDSTQNTHDIALLELDRRVKLSDFIRPACLPVKGVKTENQLIVAGWGKTQHAGNTSDMLLAANAETRDNSICDTTLNRGSYGVDSKATLCAVGQVKKGVYSDTCQGDSGGPLMAKVMSDVLECTYMVNGIVSFGPQCGIGAPAVYARVAYYMDWIVQTVWPVEYLFRS